MSDASFMTAQVKIRMLDGHPYKPIPEYATKGSSGIDLMAAIPESEYVMLTPGARRLVPAGFQLEMPFGLEAQVRSRSGLTLKRGLVVANGVGTIDSDYRGDVGVIIHNISDKTQMIYRGERIAQLVFVPVAVTYFTQVTALANTERGAGGFGSTGA
jgi:dUTP diphosphatase